MFTTPFHFHIEIEPILPLPDMRYCSYGSHTLPATAEHFAGSRDKHGNFRFQTYCRPCMARYRRERYRRLKAAGEWDKGRRRK